MSLKRKDVPNASFCHGVLVSPSRPPSHHFLNTLGQKLTQMNGQLQTIQSAFSSIGRGQCVRYLQTPGNQGNNICNSKKITPYLSETHGGRSGMADELLSTASSTC